LTAWACMHGAADCLARLVSRKSSKIRHAWRRAVEQSRRGSKI
jgi:hypothetical protein